MRQQGGTKSSSKWKCSLTYCPTLTNMNFFAVAFFVLLTPLAALAQEPAVRAPFSIDASFPGGNILVSKIEGDVVQLGPDQRDNVLPWFYWYFRVKGAANRTLTFAFRKDHVGVRGPGVSLDAGRT